MREASHTEKKARHSQWCVGRVSFMMSRNHPPGPAGKSITALVWLALFAIAMAMVEATVVVYLRTLYAPLTFHFSLKDFPQAILRIETGREFATLIMLFSVAVLTERRIEERFAVFSFLMGIWDIFYYVWLKVLTGWPASLLDWDILFLIPVPWASPVLAPVLVSLALIAGAVFILFLQWRGKPVRFSVWDGIAMAVSSAVILFSLTISASGLLSSQTPVRFRWEIFASGAAVMGVWIAVRGKIMKKKRAG